MFETKSRVCITVENSPNPSSVYIKLCKHRKNVFYCSYEITSSKNYSAGKNIHFNDQNLFSYNINLTMAFVNWPIKTYIWKSGDQRCGVFTTRVSLRHTTMFTYSNASTPLGQSERAYYLSYFIKKAIGYWFYQCARYRVMDPLWSLLSAQGAIVTRLSPGPTLMPLACLVTFRGHS